MKISAHFSDTDFLSKRTIAKIKSKRQPTTRYINRHLVEAAEFTRTFLNKHICALSSDIAEVQMILNKPGYQTRGTRKPWDNSSSGPFSDHWWSFAFDCDVIIVMMDGTKHEADYVMIYNLILDHQQEFLDAGITTIEHPDLAKTWLHLSIAWRPELTTMEIIGDGK